MENLTLLEMNLIYYENKYNLETSVYKKFKYLNIINEIKKEIGEKNDKQIHRSNR